ncbi:MAG: flippase-like domain-containing protein, partial [Nitrospiraceae bacterium]|nr:flippase-like domain-containing protein [Nitrospiraceae bacterium]
MKKKIQVLAGILLGVFLLWVVFRQTDWREVWQAIRSVHRGWFAATVGLVILSFFTRVQRWSYIVRTAKPISFRQMFSATQIGFLANFTLPMRVGELVRALVLSRLAKLPFSRCFAMVALDRITDLIGLMAVMLVAAVAYSPTETITLPEATMGVEVTVSPATIRVGQLGMVAMLLCGVATLVVLYVKQALVLRIADRVAGTVSKRLAERTHQFLQDFADGLHIFRSVSDMSKSLFFTFVTWGCFVLILQTSLLMFGVHGPWYTVFVIQVLLAIAISVPSTPSFAGPFHLAIVVSLMMLIPETDDSVAKAIAIVAHLINVVTVVGSGII